MCHRIDDIMDEPRKPLDNRIDKVKKIDGVIVKIWDMSKASQDPDVRRNTLEWAREELRKLCQLFSQPLDDKELREKITEVITPIAKNYVLGYIHNLSQLEVELKRQTDYLTAQILTPLQRQKPIPDEELRREIAQVFYRVVRQFEREGCPDPKVHIDQILALLQPKIEKAIRQERERINVIISDWDKMGQIVDGGATWRAKYGCHFKAFSVSYIEELLIVIRQALSGKGGE